jgi:rSAM/selenodomain-associated transferase 1
MEARETILHSADSDRTLVIMAKAPRPGTVKTRLARSLPVKAVTELYRCLLGDTMALARSLPGVKVAIMCPASDVEELRHLVRGEIAVVAQRGEGLAAGLTSVFAQFTTSARHVIAFNSDSPHLPLEVLAGAFELLTTNDVVIGPTHDGGYYLVGAKADHAALFYGDGMGTHSALDGLLDRARRLQLSVGFTDPFYDIDVEDDLARLAAELQLAPSRAPRTAAWLKHWQQLVPRVPKCRWRPVSLTPSHRLYGLGAILLVSLIICARRFGGNGEAFPIIPLLTAGIAYLFAIRAFFCTQNFPKRVIVIGLLLAAVWHIAFLATPTGSDDDVRRYVWDGRLQRFGYNPYVVIPDDPAFAALHTAETRGLNNPDLPSIYPPGAQLFFRAVTAIRESTLAMRVAFVICDLGVVFVLLDVLRRTGQGAHWILAYAWHPLLATEVAGSGHIDIFGVLLLVVSFAALLRRCRAIAAVAFALAVAVKFLPLVLAPLYWRRVRVRDALLAVIVFALLYLPFLSHGQIPIGSLGAYIQGFGFNDPAFAVLRQVAAPQLVAGLAVLVGFLVAIWFRTRFQGPSADAFAWPIAASLLCAPAVFPWYLLWLLPFMRSVSTLPLIIWTVSIIPTYVVWHLRTLGRPFVLPGWVMLLEYGAVAITTAVILLRRVTRPATPRSSID